MDILFITPEIAPYSQLTALGEVAGALPKALRSLGHRVTILSPLYADIDPVQRNLARRLMKIEFTLGAGRVACELYDGRTTGGVDLLFLGHEQLFRGNPRAETPAEVGQRDALRFTALAKGAVEILKQSKFDLIHGHGWPGALAIVLSRQDPALASIRSVLSVHDLADQGVFPKSVMDTASLPWDLFHTDRLEYYDQVSFLKGGFAFADRVVFPSPAYARECATQEGGHALDGVVRASAQKIVGISHGIDAARWNPAVDPEIPFRFDPVDRLGKERCKAQLATELGFIPRPDVPLLALMGPIQPADGFDLLAKSGAQILRNDVQVVLHGEGDPELTEAFAELALRWPDRFALRGRSDHAFPHRLLAGADLFAIPSRTEPAGLLAMRAARYGALPIARRTGAHADAIVDCDAKLESGTGFLYDEATPQALLGAIQRGLAAFASQEAFQRTQARAMRADHSWDRAARLYDRVYRDACIKA